MHENISFSEILCIFDFISSCEYLKPLKCQQCVRKIRFLKFSTCLKTSLNVIKFVLINLTTFSESGGVNFGPRKVRGSTHVPATLDHTNLLRELDGMDVDSINGRGSHVRSRRSADDFVLWGPIVCFIAFLLASVFVVRTSKPRVRNNRSNERRNNRVENTLV